MFLPFSDDIPSVMTSFTFTSLLCSVPEVTDSDPTPVSVSDSEPSGINELFSIEVSGPELAVREDHLDQRMVPDSESGAYESESA